MKYKNEILVFFISSYFSLITLSYLSYHDVSKISYNKISLMMPTMYGIMGLINYKLQMPTLFGTFVGITLSLIGRFKFKIPEKVFLMKESNEMDVHFYAVMIYITIFNILDNLNKQILPSRIIEDQNSS